jgi:hypothetical protein
MKGRVYTIFAQLTRTRKPRNCEKSVPVISIGITFQSKPLTRTCRNVFLS